MLSLELFHYIAQFTAGASLISTAAISFLLLLIPTLLMGSTLPLLVAFLVRRTENVGESVGSLYAANTLGSAVACFPASMFLMRVLGQSGSTYVAAMINLIVGGTAMALSFRDTTAREPKTTPTHSAGHFTISMPLGMLFAAASGFIAHVRRTLTPGTIESLPPRGCRFRDQA